jgi:hypothetical protein
MINDHGHDQDTFGHIQGVDSLSGRSAGRLSPRRRRYLWLNLFYHGLTSGPLRPAKQLRRYWRRTDDLFEKDGCQPYGLAPSRRSLVAKINHPLFQQVTSISR